MVAESAAHVPPAFDVQSASTRHPLQTQLRSVTVHLQAAKSGLFVVATAQLSGVLSVLAGAGALDGAGTVGAEAATVTVGAVTTGSGAS